MIHPSVSRLGGCTRLHAFASRCRPARPRPSLEPRAVLLPQVATLSCGQDSRRALAGQALVRPWSGRPALPACDPSRAAMPAMPAMLPALPACWQRAAASRGGQPGGRYPVSAPAGPRGPAGNNSAAPRGAARPRGLAGRCGANPGQPDHASPQRTLSGPAKGLTQRGCALLVSSTQRSARTAGDRGCRSPIVSATPGR